VGILLRDRGPWPRTSSRVPKTVVDLLPTIRHAASPHPGPGARRNRATALRDIVTSANLHPERAQGFAAAAGCYLLWGVVPIYWKQLGAVESVEVIAHRSLWSLVTLFALLAATNGFGAVRAALRDPRMAARSLFTSLLLAANWLIYVYGVNTGRVSECSLGYFLVPLVNVATGRLLLMEPITRPQGAAIAIAAVGVCWMVAQQAETPWLAFGLAATWGCYGLLRKRATIGAAAGLAVETILISPIALGYVLFVEASGDGAFWRGEGSTQGWLASTGVVTVIPLWMFAYGASRIRLATLGLLQYIAPSVQLGVGISLYGEAFPTERAVGFACIWTGLAIYTIDNLFTMRAARGR
jgi:chloramphenicol-sensitive protein RarD